MDRWLLTALFGVLVLGGCSREPERWTAFVYPPGKSMAAEDAHLAIYGRFSTFADCQTAAIASLQQHLRGMTDEETDELGMGDYECGLGCRFEPKYSLYMCKETRK